MDTIVMRCSRSRLERMIASLKAAYDACGDPAERAALQADWSWLVHRYTSTWGLPPGISRPAAGRGGRGGDGRPAAGQASIPV